MTKQIIDQMADQLEVDLIRAGHTLPLAERAADRLKAALYRTYGIKEEAPDARN